MRALAAVFVVAGLMVGPGASSALASLSLNMTPEVTAEGTAFTVTVTRSLTALEMVFDAGASATVTTGNATDTATAGSDYTAVTAPLTWAAGETGARTVPVNTLQDSLDEADELVTVKLTNASESATPSALSRTITDDDAEPTLAIGDATVAEGTGGNPTVITFPVSLSSASGREITAGFSTADGTATAGQDYTAVTTGALRFPAGTTTADININVTPDDVVEPSENFTVTLADILGATAAAGGTATGTITNDDAAPTLSITGPAPTPEGSNGLTTPFAFTITLSKATSTSLQVAYATNDGSATAPADYSSTELTVTFAPGETQKVVTIPIVADRAIEPNENFSVSLSETAGLVATVGEASAIIVDDDTPVVAPPPPPPPADTTAPRVTLSKITSSRGVMRVTVTCPAGESVCRGTMTVFNVPAKKSKVKALRREVKLASTLFVLRGGERARLTLRPGKRAAGYIRQARTVRTRGYAVARDAAGNVATVRTTGTVKAAR